MVDSKENKCIDCMYSFPAITAGLVYCSYIGDVMRNDGIENGYNLKLGRDLVTTIGLKADVYESFVDFGGEEPLLAPTVNQHGRCRKFMKRIS